jgi:outer membrane protein OmpA-like peptidoglycan-associated protein
LGALLFLGACGTSHARHPATATASAHWRVELATQTLAGADVDDGPTYVSFVVGRAAIIAGLGLGQCGVPTKRATCPRRPDGIAQLSCGGDPHVDRVVCFDVVRHASRIEVIRSEHDLDGAGKSGRAVTFALRDQGSLELGPPEYRNTTYFEPGDLASVNVQFSFESATVAQSSEANLGLVARFMALHEEVTTLYIDAYADDIGVRDYARRLMASRAMSVATWLVDHGVDCHRLAPVVIDDASVVTCNDCPHVAKRARGIELRVAPVRDGRPAGDPCHTHE